MTYSLRHLFHQKLAAAGVWALFAVAATPVLATSYGAGIENSQWYLSESVFEWSLVHEVPGYGRAVFRHRAGEALSFYLESEIPVMRPGRGQLVVEAPAWRPGVAPRAIGSVTVSDQPRAVTVSSREATLMAQGCCRACSQRLPGQPVMITVQSGCNCPTSISPALIQ